MAPYNNFKKRKAFQAEEVKNNVTIDIGKNKQVSVRRYNGVNLVDIREYYLDKASGELRPGKKGISLTEESWNLLVENQSKIEDALLELNGGTKKPKISKDTVDEEDEKEIEREVEEELKRQEEEQVDEEEEKPEYPEKDYEDSEDDEEEDDDNFEDENGGDDDGEEEEEEEESNFED
ncbi:hypothetical protein PACTADRAFT_80039 [Pachysolen tannophilus NRRL Y-2460]|uniref:Transcriptional coactivator p15 (PC4) C-terminal domain-containing protein n=1 Tax=Pachysolen tannophilus NRRL Y-2460 TaxID=669874 RepID=A0A1E4TW42_PACTA|nr:hypothetical protein PACTADRAFT_80039 [Pachysolen tannophilus NRRL Y-2460]